MKFESVLHSDVGIKKKTNQDSMLLKEAETGYGKVLLAAVCDGMGGLAKGEVASATVIRRLSDWFDSRFPHLLYDKKIIPGSPEFPNWIRNELTRVAVDANRDIYNYGRTRHTSLGSTAVVLLLTEQEYFVLNIGDSRCYLVYNRLEQLTKDQSLVQHKIDSGRLREEDAEKDPDRNVLLQCIGVTASVEPDFYTGRYQPETVFFLCSDGFRHVLSKEELFRSFLPSRVTSRKVLRDTCVNLTETDKQRKETDNISIIAIHAAKG